MNAKIELPDDVGDRLAQRAAASGMDLSGFVERLLRERLREEPSELCEPLSHEEFSARLHEIIARHGIRCGSFDDSRESIYAGRGE